MASTLVQRPQCVLPPACLLLFCLWPILSRAAYVSFSNCLDSGTRTSTPRLLQFVPLNATAFFDSRNPTHALNVSIYGNVTGQTTAGVYPGPNDPSWNDNSSTFGKIVAVPEGAPMETTLFGSFNVLTYTPYTAPAAGFCDSVIHDSCPVGPAFYTSSADIQYLPGWTVSHSMEASYAFTEIVLTSKIQSGYVDGRYYGCVNAFITPDLGAAIRDIIRYLAVGILVMTGVATVTAAMFSPWRTWDIFRWTSNFGRDEDVLRLVTPGFADCLQYLQFIVLTGSLSLNYPGFYQPVVSQLGWSSLLFNQSFVADGSGTNPIVDGIYQYRSGSKGLDRMTQLIGMTSPSDAWSGMMVWLVAIIAAAVVLTQLCFGLRWAHRQIMHIPPEDLRSKNWYFTMGNVVRLALGFFILPLVSLSMYQFAIASLGPVYAIALATVVLIAIIAFSTRLMLLFIRTRPRSFLFDDLQTVLAYGPLYNTYCDNAATFAMIPILVNLLRGIAIGAVQASGVAQLIVLAICEIIFLSTINMFRPFPAATSMNLYHSCFSVLRLLTVLLSVAFAPSLNVGYASRGWIGYVILLIHGLALVFGFFVNAIQTLIEVIARRAGAGGSADGDAARGGLVKVFGMRQLSKRRPRADTTSRHSMGSHAAMLGNVDGKDLQMSKTRTRSMSASSQMLLDGAARSQNRTSGMYPRGSDGQITPDAESTFSRRQARQSLPTGTMHDIQQAGINKDPFYRPPRRNTMDLLQSPEQISPGTEASAPFDQAATLAEPPDNRDGAATPLRIEDFDDANNELTKTKTDYAVREVDFYYGVRGSALSSGTRRLKTGPADPTGPVSSASGWFRGLLGGRKKEKSRGFEVVRSARAPPLGSQPHTDVELDSEMIKAQPYHDTPVPGEASSSRKAADRNLLVPGGDADHDKYSFYSDDEVLSGPEIPAQPPLLPNIDPVGGIDMPSRVGSEMSKKSRKKQPNPPTAIPEMPSIPTRSTRRSSSVDIGQGSTTDGTGKLISPFEPQHPGRMPFTKVQNPASSIRPGVSTVSRSSAISRSSGQEQKSPRSADAAHVRQLSSTQDRPSSVGYVREHRASDGITHSAAILAGQEARSAEIYGSDDAPVSPPWSNTEMRSGSPINPYGQPGQRSSRFRD